MAGTCHKGAKLAISWNLVKDETTLKIQLNKVDYERKDVINRKWNKQKAKKNTISKVNKNYIFKNPFLFKNNSTVPANLKSTEAFQSNKKPRVRKGCIIIISVDHKLKR